MDTLDGQCPITVGGAPMVMRWDRLTFIHWEVDPAELQRRLPDGLTVDTFDGRAYVGLVPFLMQVRAGRGPAVPWLSNFCETNVRTYVAGPDGKRGVWFLSLDAARLAAVVTARVTYRLPYFWSKMSIEQAGDRWTYTNGRRWPGPRSSRSLVEVEVGEPYRPDELTALDHFLTARWRLYSARRRGMRYALAQHDPWPLHRARLVRLDDELVAAARMPRLLGEPICHWSPGTEVRISVPHRA